jgi:hypothetical protein
VARTRSVSWFLWLLTSSWLAACGRFEFDALGSAPPGDPPGTPPGDPPGDAPPGDAPPGDAPPDNADNTPAPVLQVATMLALDALCGVPPDTIPVQLAVTNTGTADLVIDSATVPDASEFGVSPGPTQIAPGATEMITVRPPRADIGTHRAGTMVTDTLTLQTNAGTREVALVATVVGANIDLQMPAGATELRFTSSSDCPAPQTVVVRNTGNAAITIDQLVANGVAFSGFSGGSIARGTSVTTAVRPFTTSECAASGRLVYEAASGLCATTELDVTLDITGSSSSCFCS